MRSAALSFLFFLPLTGLYPANEETSNLTNWAAVQAVNDNSADAFSSHLWWNK